VGGEIRTFERRDLMLVQVPLHLQNTADIRQSICKTVGCKIVGCKTVGYKTDTYKRAGFEERSSDET
jgi:hypothetical protein